MSDGGSCFLVSLGLVYSIFAPQLGVLYFSGVFLVWDLVPVVICGVPDLYSLA